jgi:hypothetical protein
MNARSFPKAFACSYCGTVETGEPQWCIHRDGFDDGPQVPLCSGCGENDNLSCDDIWTRIALPSASGEPNRALN